MIMTSPSAKPKKRWLRQRFLGLAEGDDSLGLVRVRVMVVVKVRVKIRFRVQKYLGFDP